MPDNTGYITEGQFYLKDGVIEPFGSLSRLKQNVVGKEKREDHDAIMNTMIRFFSGARDAQRKHNAADHRPFFPIAQGGAACIPGPFGAGKTVLLNVIARHSDLDVVVLVACGERAGDVVETITEFPISRTRRRAGR